MKQNKDLGALLSNDEMLTLPEVADELGLAVTRVHDLLHDKKLIAHLRDGVSYVPRHSLMTRAQSTNTSPGPSPYYLMVVSATKKSSNTYLPKMTPYPAVQLMVCRDIWRAK